MTPKIKNFFFNQVSPANKLLLLLILLTFLLGTLFILLNQHEFHFTHINLYSQKITAKTLTIDISVTILCLLMFFFGIQAKNSSPRGSTFIWGTSAIILTVYANIVLTNGIQTTPFSPIDAYLARFDAMIGINTPAIMRWVHQYPHFHHALSVCYELLIIELIILPLSLACLNRRRTLTIFLLAQLSTFILGALIYYFFPTMAPSGIFHSPYFSTTQHDTSMRFHQVHHFLPVTTAKGGLIAFPSFHVIWSVLLCYCAIDIKWIFYPLCCLNTCIIISTVLLGWHYGADVIAGLLIAFAGIYFSIKIINAEKN